MWPLLKMFVLKHYTVNNIQSSIYTQMYNRFTVIKKEALWIFLKIRTMISSVQAYHRDSRTNSISLLFQSQLLLFRPP